MDNPSSLTLAGIGLHSGRHSRLTLRLRGAETPPASAGGRPDSAPESPGPRFRFPGLGSIPAEALGGLPRRSRRATLLGDGEASLATPEHLMAALLFFSALPLDVDGDAPELPGLDGSALPYREALARLDPCSAADPAWREYPADLSWEYHWSYGYVRIRPASRFRVRWELDRGPLRQAFTLEDAATAYAEILPARTFAFHREWQEATAQGLMAGATDDSGLLLAETENEYRQLLERYPQWPGGPYPLLNRPSWRGENELAKHKILDLLGDLGLLGLALPRADIEIRNGGHAVNHMLVDRLAAGRIPA